MSLMNEYITKGMSAKDLEDELFRLIRGYNDNKGTYLFVYAGVIAKQIPGVQLDMDDYYVIFDMLKNVNLKNLDFYIETPGGSAEAVEEIAKFIRSKFENIAFVISGQAKSAGTILALSGDEIFMSDSGSLGPIDAQIKIGRIPVSACDYIGWVERKRKELEEKGKLNPLDATMVAQISPGEISLVDHALKFAEDLVIDWLPRYKFKNWKVTETRKIPVTEKMKKERAKEVVKKLMDRTKWRTHGRSIKIGDLTEKIGLKITRMDDNPKLADIVYKIQTVIRLLFGSTPTYKIYATATEKLFKQAIPRTSPLQIPAEEVLRKAESAEVKIQCPKCGKTHKFYARFIDSPKIDKDFKNKGVKSFPKDNKLICDCGFEIDLSGIRNEVETKFDKKILN